MPVTTAAIQAELSSDRVLLVANPIAGGRRGRKRLDEAIHLLRSHLTISEVRWTQNRGDAETWARESVAKEISLVIGWGGDGTLNEIANGLAGSAVALGILPAGTTNVIACELDIPFNPVEAAKCLLNGRKERVHLGCAEYSPLTNSSTDAKTASNRTTRCFFFAAGLGFDALVCHRVNPALKHWGRKAAYCFDGFRLFPGYRSPRLRVTIDNAEPVVCSELIIAKARSYAGRFCISPDASLHKPDLDACLFLRRGRWNLLRYAWGILRGKHLTYSDVACRKAQSIEVAADDPVYLQLDGDTVGMAPARFTVRRDALSIIVPTV